MANTVWKNTAFIDTAATGITFDAVVPKAYGLLLTPSAANARIIIKETNTSGKIWLDFKAESGNESRFISWQEMGGLQITSTIYIATLTNVQAAFLYGDFFLQAGKAQ